MKTPVCASLQKGIFLKILPALLISSSTVISVKAQVIVSISHNDTYDFDSQPKPNLVLNPNFELFPPTGNAGDVWFAIINATSPCGNSVIPNWTTGPVGHESYASLSKLRQRPANSGKWIINDAAKSLNGPFPCSGIPFGGKFPDYVMDFGPPQVGTDPATNWMIYYGNYEETKKITGVFSLNAATGEVVPANTPLSFIADGSGTSSANTPKILGFVTQTVPTVKCHSYELEFFLTGEGYLGTDSTDPEDFFPADGILELTIGNQLLHLMSPGTGNFHGLGKSEIYHIKFTSNATSVAIKFASPGHIRDTVAFASPSWAPYMKAPVTVLAADLTKDTAYHSSDIFLDGVRVFETDSTDCVVLSPELLSFDAKKEDNDIRLSWQTGPERSTDMYEVQYSTDGNQWGAIGQVPASPGSSGPAGNYSFIHKNYSAGANYYRLRIIHDDSRFDYSAIKLVQGSPEKNLTAGPNPVKDRLQITGTLGAIFDEVEIMDLQGRRLSIYHHLLSGNSIDMTACPSGIYLLKITEKGKTPIIKRIEKI